MTFRISPTRSLFSGDVGVAVAVDGEDVHRAGRSRLEHAADLFEVMGAVFAAEPHHFGFGVGRLDGGKGRPDQPGVGLGRVAGLTPHAAANRPLIPDLEVADLAAKFAGEELAVPGVGGDGFVGTGETAVVVEVVAVIED